MTIKGRKQDIEISAKIVFQFLFNLILGIFWVMLRTAVLKIQKIRGRAVVFTGVKIINPWEDYKDLDLRSYMEMGLKKCRLTQYSSDQGRFLMCHGAKDGTLLVNGLRKSIEELSYYLDSNEKYFLIACYNQSRKQGFHQDFGNIDIVVPENLTRDLTHTIGDFLGEDEFVCVASPLLTNMLKLRDLIKID